MHGLLRSAGWHIGENRIGKSLRRTNPVHHHRRETTAYRLINPRMYSAHHFGHKLHVDQNEKLCMFGVTHVLAIDGYSGKIVSLVSMPKKNCCIIYEHVLR